MYEILIKEYVNKLTEEDIKKYANKYNIEITDNEVKVLYLYAKNYWKEFYKGQCDDLFDELKEKLNPNTYNIVYKLYLDAKSKINH